MKSFLLVKLGLLLLFFNAAAQEPKVTTGNVTNVTTNSAVATANAVSQGGSSITEMGIVYGIGANPTITNGIQVTATVALGNFSCRLENLTPGTTYHLRAFATNSTGTDYGNDISFTTGASGATLDVARQIRELDEISNRINAFIANQKNSIFKFGISVAIRSAFNTRNEKKARAIVTVSPHDNLVQIDYNDMMAVVISSTVAAYPFKSRKNKDGSIKDDKKGANLGFLANINLAEFADSKSSTIFNKQVDGGVGLSYLMGTKQQFALALTYERISVRQPTEYVFKKEGYQIIGDNNNPLTALDGKDARFFRDAGMNGISVKFVFHFN